MGLSSYEECRQKRVDENKKRLEDLNLIHLSQSLKNLSPKPSPMKKVVSKPRTVEKQMVPVRRSARVSSNPAPVYAEISMSRLLSSPRSNYGVGRGCVWNGVYASDEARANAIEKAEKLVSKLEHEGFPTVIRPMLPSHVSSCFWLGLPSHFCRRHLPSSDTTITLVDEEGNECPTIYLQRKTGLSGGWRGFAIDHRLSDGDAVVFQLISPSVMKVIFGFRYLFGDCVKPFSLQCIIFRSSDNLICLQTYIIRVHDQELSSEETFSDA